MDQRPNTAEPAKPRRRWFQFRLRTLLVGVVLIGTAVGYVAHETQIVRERKALLDSGVVVASNIDFSRNMSWLRRCLGDKAFTTLYLLGPADVIERCRIAFPEAEIRTAADDTGP